MYLYARLLLWKKALFENISIKLAVGIGRPFSGMVLSAFCKRTLLIYFGTWAPGTQWRFAAFFLRVTTEYGEVVGDNWRRANIWGWNSCGVVVHICFTTTKSSCRVADRCLARPAAQPYIPNYATLSDSYHTFVSHNAIEYDPLMPKAKIPFVHNANMTMNANDT